MTVISRNVRAIVTLPILGGVTRRENGSIQEIGEKYCIHIYAVIPGMKYCKSTTTHHLVGIMYGGGYTSEPFKRSEDVLLPEGHELIALRVGNDGQPTTWDHLPLKVKPIFSAAETFSIESGRVFISDTLPSIKKQFSEDISKAVRETIKRELQPGGLLSGR